MRKKNRTYHPRRLKVDGYACQDHPSYYTWASMMSRCYDPNAPAFLNYGGRGILVHPSWHHFRFFAQDMGVPPSKEHSIERKDNSKGYSKENCVWATASEQCLNRRTFRSNTSGHVGVVKVGDRQWEARFNYEGVRYSLGRFTSREAALGARTQFKKTFEIDRTAAIATLLPKDQVIWNTSTTRRRGVCPHADGRGFIARCTINGERHYVGYFLSVEEAAYARDRYIKEQTH